MCAKWKNEFNPNFVLSKLIESKQISEKGRVSFKTDFFEEYITFLVSSIEIDRSIPELIKRKIIADSTFKSFMKNTVNPQVFLAKVNAGEKEYLNQKLSEFVFITEVSILFMPRLSKIFLNNCSIIFDKKVSKKYSRKKFINEVPDFIRERFPNNYTSVRVNVNARSDIEAGELAFSTLEFLLGIWNLSINSQIIFRTIYGHPEPFNSILLGPVHTLHHKNGKLASDVYWYDPNFIKPIKPSNLEKSWDHLKSTEKYIRSRLSKLEYKNDLIEAIKRYGRALDERDSNSVFIRLWSLLEYLTSTTFDSYKKTIQRTTFIYPNSDYHSQILNQIKNYRNEFVHSDKTSALNMTYIQQLRRYVEHMLFFHLNNLFSFKTIDEACNFLDNSKDTIYIEENIRSLKNALKFRRSKYL